MSRCDGVTTNGLASRTVECLVMSSGGSSEGRAGETKKCWDKIAVTEDAA